MSRDWYLRNYWYVAAQSEELGEELLARTLCGEPVVLYRRRSDGAPQAVLDRCPHRRYPLSKGQVVGDEIQCGYHGVRFGGGGRCTFVPGQALISPTFGVKAYPVTERYGFVWVWMGEAAADPEAIPSVLSVNDTPGWERLSGLTTFEANYLLAMDNSLDMTHLAFVHLSTLASPELVFTPNTVTMDGESFVTGRVMENIDLPPMMKAVTNLPAKIDRSFQTTFLLPGILVGDFRQAPAKALGETNIPGVRTWMNAYFTPETERSTHFFWSQTRSFAVGDRTVSEKTLEMLGIAFAEDAEVLADQQRAIDADGGLEAVRLVDLAADNGCVAARGLIRRKLKAQSQASAA